MNSLPLDLDVTNEYFHDLCYLLCSTLRDATTIQSRTVFAGLVTQLRKAMVNRQLSDSQQISTLINVFFMNEREKIF